MSTETTDPQNPNDPADQDDPATTATPPAAAAESSATTGAGEEEPLGDAGRRALADERRARREAETRAREALERAAELERAELVRAVAGQRGLTDAQAAFLTGGTEAELTESADRLLAAFATPEPAAVRRLPREALRRGAVPGAADAPSMGKVADDVIGAW